MNRKKPIVISGPCAAESFEVMDAAAQLLSNLQKELDFDFYFKASFDKANRTALDSYRGSGLDQTMTWFSDIKSKYGCKVLTDIHETQQVDRVAEVCDGLQIPAFLCRQTDLVVKAVQTQKFVNIKKGQFLAPKSTEHIAQKVKDLSLIHI